MHKLICFPFSLALTFCRSKNHFNHLFLCHFNAVAIGAIFSDSRREMAECLSDDDLPIAGLAAAARAEPRTTTAVKMPAPTRKRKQFPAAELSAMRVRTVVTAEEVVPIYSLIERKDMRDEEAPGCWVIHIPVVRLKDLWKESKALETSALKQGHFLIKGIFPKDIVALLRDPDHIAVKIYRKATNFMLSHRLNRYRPLADTRETIFYLSADDVLAPLADALVQDQLLLKEKQIEECEKKSKNIQKNLDEMKAYVKVLEARLRPQPHFMKPMSESSRTTQGKMRTVMREQVEMILAWCSEIGTRPRGLIIEEYAQDGTSSKTGMRQALTHRRAAHSIV